MPAAAAASGCPALSVILAIWRTRPGRQQARGSSSTKRAGAISKGWDRDFDDPIALPDGRSLVTLIDAGNCILALPEQVHTAAEWQAAMEALILVADFGGPNLRASVSCER
jgi:hypothetical protein